MNCVEISTTSRLPDPSQGKSRTEFSAACTSSGSSHIVENVEVSDHSNVTASRLTVDSLRSMYMHMLQNQITK